MSQLEKEYDNNKKGYEDLKYSVKNEMELLSFSPIREDDWIQYAKRVINPGLDYTKTRFVNVNTVNTGRGAFGINMGLEAKHEFTTTAIFNPEILAKKDLDQVKSYLHDSLYFDFVTKEIVDDAILEADVV